MDLDDDDDRSPYSSTDDVEEGAVDWMSKIVPEDDGESGPEGEEYDSDKAGRRDIYDRVRRLWGMTLLKLC